MEKIEKNRVTLEVQVEPQRVAQALQLVYRAIANRANIPGFRRGKAPRRLIENYFGREYLYNQALDRLIPEAYAAAVEQTKIEPIDQPEVELVQLEEGRPLVFKATVEVKPEVSLGEYKGIVAEKRVRPVTEADVDRYLENLRQHYARLVDLGEERLAAGDLAIIDYEGTVQGKPFSHSRAEGVAVEVGGPAPWPGFSTQLAGLRSGEEREIRVTLPQDYPQGELAGQEAVFHVRVREAKRRELSPLDDEFAKDVSEFETLQELKQDIANRLREDALREAENRVREQVVAKAVEAASLEVPSTLVERRLRSLLADLEARLRQQGLTLEEYLRLTDGKMEDVQAGLRAEAEATVRRELVLEAIAQREGLSVSDEELAEELEAVARRTGREVAAVKEQLAERGLEGLRVGLLQKKAADFLVKHARIEVREP